MNPEITGTDRFVDRLARDTRLDPLADAIQPIWRTLLNSDGPLRTPVKDLLHGTWLGHSLHPIITDVPIGAWTVAALCDVVAIGGSERFASAADISIAIGALGAAGAALTGWAEWSDTEDEPKRLGLAHAALNGVALTGYLLSLGLRANGRRGGGTALALGMYALVTAGAYLGGELSTGLQIGVRHTVTPLDPPDEFIDACDDADLIEGALKAVTIGGIAVLLSRTEGRVAAISNVCSHRGAPLDEGSREGNCVRCPWHGARFDLESGAAREGPATFPLPAFETRVAQGKIQVRLS
jgi:nitrite reductase/ring-hydroxylating ferredoxin subunit/uncharacterized membrane protein